MISAASACSLYVSAMVGCALRVVSATPPDAAARDAIKARCDGGLVTCGGDCVDRASGLIACGDACVDTRTNAAHCGGCERRCVAGQSCVDGGCVGVEMLAQRSCGGAATPVGSPSRPGS